MATDTSAQLGIDGVSERAMATARTLLRAYYLQDEREAHLVHGNVDAASETGSRAIVLMADVFEREFPTRPTPKARRAGEQFMIALFLQDEIENWQVISGLSGERYDGVLVSDLTATYDAPAATDVRWETVRDHLSDLCANVGIDDAYAEKQARFWLLHGQLHEYWEAPAKQAHDLKLEAMVGSVPPEAKETLTSSFVRGVKRHDEWTHGDRHVDFDGLVDLVARYYQKLFDLRNGD